MWNVLVPALTSLAGMMFGGGGKDTPQMTPEMRQMLQIQLQRMRGQEPLYNDVMGMARGLLPTRYRRTSTRLPVRPGVDGTGAVSGGGVQGGVPGGPIRPVDIDDPRSGRPGGRPGGKF